MSTITTLKVLAAAGCLAVSSVQAAPAKVVKTAPHVAVVVRPGFPLHRALPPVVVRAPHATVRVAPALFLPPVVWTRTVVVLPAATRIVSEDSETLDHSEGWTDFTLNVEDRGRRLYLQVAGGRAKLSFAEIVFANGDTQVVDFNDKAVGPGVYSLLDFRDGRELEHVRMVAAAASDSVKIIVKMEK